MEFTKKLSGDVLEISISGRLDATTAPELQSAVLNGLNDIKKVVISVKNLEYISSAGLRVILMIKKTVNDTCVIDASTEVYDIFEMTGFSEMMSVSKAFREISVEGCKIIGRGYYGTVYRLSKDTIVKVYSNKMTLDRINNERELARKAFVLGVPTAIPYDIVKVGENYGSVFELLDAQTLQEKIINDIDNIDKYIKQSVDVLKVIHAAQVKPGELNDKKTEVLEWAHYIRPFLSKEIGDRVISLVEGINDDTHIMHGDYHIKNVMMIGDDPFIIDMDTLSMGSPIFELGFMYSSYVGYQEIDHHNGLDFFGIDYDHLIYIFNRSIELYCDGKTKEEIDLVIKKARILCYIQLIDRFDKYQDHPELFERFKSQLSDLVFEVEDLNF